MEPCTEFIAMLVRQVNLKTRQAGEESFVDVENTIDGADPLQNRINTEQHRAAQKLPWVHNIVLRKDKRLPDLRVHIDRHSIEGLLVQSRGALKAYLCPQCLLEQGTFANCIVLVGHFEGVCGNCHKNSKDRDCCHGARFAIGNLSEPVRRAYESQRATIEADIEAKRLADTVLAAAASEEEAEEHRIARAERELQAQELIDFQINRGLYL